MSSIDEICPSYIGEDRIDLSLASDGTIRAFSPVRIAVDYSRTAPEGTVLPLEMIVQGPSEQSFSRKVFSRTPPVELIFTPKERGSHLVLLREFAHNRWWGRVQISVDGQALESPKRS